MTPITTLTTNKQINSIIVRLGHHLICKTSETNLNKDFYTLLNLLSEFPFAGIDRFQKFQKINKNILELLQIEEAIDKNKLTMNQAKTHYLDLYYNVIDTFLGFDKGNPTNGDTYYDHVA